MGSQLFKLWMAIVLLVSGAAAAEPLSATLSVPGGRTRAGAPQSVDIELNWKGTGLLEGVLEVSSPEGSRQAVSFRPPELALTNGLRKIRLLLPLMARSDDGENRVLLRFRTASRVIDLGQFSAGLRASGRQVVICVGAPQISSGRSTLWNALRLEDLEAPGPSERPLYDPVSMAVTTTPLFLDPEDFPTEPLAYCGYDVVLLEGDSFSKLGAKQLAALRIWLRAGGSLCVAPATDLPAAQAGFLTQLAGGVPSATQPPAAAAARCFEAGLGRVIVLNQTGPALAKTDGWKAAVGFLWKRRITYQSASGDDAIQSVTATLMPKSIHMIPRAAIAAILGGFLLTIGPLDYWLLGKLRRRRWTWGLLPLIAVGCTSLTVWMAGRAMGNEDSRTSLLVTDLSADGQVVRESRFELIFAARPKMIQTPVTNSLWAAIADGYAYQRYRQSDTVASPPVIAGQFPARYTVTQSLRQWTPQLNRMTRLLAASDESKLPWEQIAKLEEETPAGEALRADSILNKQPWDLMCLRGSPKSAGSQPLTKRSSIQEWPSVPYHLLQELTVRAAPGGLSAVYQLSPNGAGNFDDLAMMDTNQPGARVLIAVRREGPVIHIYRRPAPASQKKEPSA